MRVAVTIHSLEGLGGTETYVATLGDQLQRNGHQVWVYGRGRGPGSQLAEQMGLRVAGDVRDLPDDLELAIPQDAPSALDVAAAYPRLPQLFVSHTELFDVGLPPQLEGALCAIVTLYERAHQRILAQSVEVPVERLRQPVDISRFKPTSVLSERARSAIAFGNYLSVARRELIEQACAAAGIELVFGGASGGELDLAPEQAINRHDIVFAKGKLAHEAMGCGRAVYVLDHNGAEGWVTAENYETLVKDNFGGRASVRPLTAELLAEDLRGYDPRMGTVNRDLIVSNHDAIAHAAALTELARKYAASGEPRHDPANVEELARLVRVNWRHESDAFQARRQLELASLELGDARWRAETAEAELTQVRDERDHLLTRMPKARLKRLLGR
jgi:hypothetical protein